MSWLARFDAWKAELRRRRHDLVGINRRNVTLVYPNNPRKHFPIADDKLLAKALFEQSGVPVARTLAVCEGLFAVRRTVDALAEHEQFVIKPANGSGGQGILVAGERVRPGVWRKAGGQEVTAAAMEKHLADIIFGSYSKVMDDQAFVEERVFPHPFFQTLWKDGLCDLRVITLQGQPLMSMIRVPTSESEGKANLHQGGLGIAIDLGTGVTTRAVHHGRSITHHPETGIPLLDLAVPDWERILDVAVRTARCVPLGYLGVDVVLDGRRGPLVLEINARPGLEIQNVNGRGLGPAVRSVQS